MQALCPMEAGQGGMDRVCCERLRLDSRKDLALRSSRFSFRMSWSGLGSSGVRSSTELALGGRCSISCLNRGAGLDDLQGPVLISNS